LHRAQPQRLASETRRRPARSRSTNWNGFGARWDEADDRAGTMARLPGRALGRVSTGTTPLVLSPDDVWHLHRAGLRSSHNAECRGAPGALRSNILGKITLKTRRDDFVKGSPHNRGPDVFEEFSRQIARQAGTAHDLVVADFSTTGVVERAASQLGADGRECSATSTTGFATVLWHPTYRAARDDGRLAADTRARRYVPRVRLDQWARYECCRAGRDRRTARCKPNAGSGGASSRRTTGRVSVVRLVHRPFPTWMADDGTLV